MKQEWIKPYLDTLDKENKLKYYRDCIDNFIINGEIFESNKDGDFILTKSPKFNFSECVYSIPYFNLLKQLMFVDREEEEIYIPIRFIEVLMNKIKEDNLKPNKREKKIIDILVERKIGVQNYLEKMQWTDYNLNLFIRKNDIFYKVLYKYNIPFFSSRGN